jgi:3-hydroxyisobutyrate dehydrogenase
MLADASAVISAFEDALPGIDPTADPHAIWLQMSTIGEAATRRCENLANSSGIGFVDGPVLGTREPAERGELVILESGPEEARPRVQPVFDAIGYRVIRAGQAGAGTRLKIVVNSWVLSVVEAGAETIALAEGLGIDPDLFFKAIKGGALDLPYLRTKGSAMAARDFRRRSGSRWPPRTPPWSRSPRWCMAWTCRYSTRSRNGCSTARWSTVTRTSAPPT